MSNEEVISNFQTLPSMKTSSIGPDGKGCSKCLVPGMIFLLERLSTASVLYMDGTFKSCPALFFQLFTV